MFFRKNKDGSASSEDVSPEVIPTKSRKSIRTIVALSVFVVTIVGSLGAAGYFYTEYQRVVKNHGDDLATTTEEVGKIYALPTDETPTLATISDKEKLSGERFFVHAENGDKVLIYTNAGQAILYRPSQGKIINVAPVNMTNNDGVSQESAPKVAGEEMVTQPSVVPVQTAVKEKAKVALYNGTTKKGLTGDFELSVTSVFSDAEVTIKENAGKNDYEKTVIVDISGKQAALVAEMATKFGTSAVTLPEGETAPEADILVILGSDRL